jgi:carbonic anhydrase
MSISTEDLVARNASFAAAGMHAGLPFPTNEVLRVVGCVDSRVDPSDVLGLALGDAVVMLTSGAGSPRKRSARGHYWVGSVRVAQPAASS